LASDLIDFVGVDKYSKPEPDADCIDLESLSILRYCEFETGIAREDLDHALDA